MNLIAVVDDRNGMMFNKRRQSRDRILCEKVISLVGKKRLWMNSYSVSIFEGFEKTSSIVVDDDFIRKAARGDFCFVEDTLPEEKDIEKIYLFKWNRAYPGDFYFDIDLGVWDLEETEDFAGYSHKNITMEVYTR